MNLKELEYLNPKSILDVGANVGCWSTEAKNVWPDATIYMIEANPECEEHLKATGFPYTICVLADETKDVDFYQRKCGGTSTGDSIYRENTQWYDDESLVVTKHTARDLNSVCYAHEYDLIKADTQGSELDIFKGGTDIVSKAKYIIMEIPVDGEHEPYNIGAPTRTEVMEYMDSIGFKLGMILEDICHPIERHIIQQDVLFVRK